MTNPYDAEAIMLIPLGHAIASSREGPSSQTLSLPIPEGPTPVDLDHADLDHEDSVPDDLIPDVLAPESLAPAISLPGVSAPEDPIREVLAPGGLAAGVLAPETSIPDDVLVWHSDADGVYTVRSGYRLARSKSCTGPSSSVPLGPRWWNTLWSLRVPPKIKHLVWRMWFNVLPTFGALRSRGIDCLPFCKFCGALPEDSLHAIWTCPRAHAIWKSSTLQRWADKTGDLPLQDLCLRAMDSLSEDHLELFCGLAWAAWRDRNSRLFDSTHKCPELWVEETATWIASFKSASVPPLRPAEGSRSRHAQWVGAENGGLTLNVDASWAAGRSLATAGGVVRDARGTVLGVTAARSAVADSPLSAECSAILHGLTFARNRGWQIEVVETDCLRATQLINGKKFFSLQGPILRNIALLLPQGATIRWIPRTRNLVAHALAHSCTSEEASDFWSFGCPEWLTMYVARDLVPLN